jgi:glycerol-3-phosphate dehydrogenase
LPGAGALDASSLERDYPFLDRATASRLVRLYGSEARAILGGARSTRDLGRDFGLGLFAREAEFLVAEEWARSAEDILWRRTKLGLEAPAAMVGELAAFLERSAVPGEAALR